MSPCGRNVFSRKLDALWKLNPSIARIYSVDKTTVHTPDHPFPRICRSAVRIAA